MGAVTVTRQQEVELPNTVSVLFLNKDADYQQSVQVARRQASNSVQTLTVTLAIAMGDVEARNIAERILYSIWAERNTVTVKFPRKYSYLEPTDVVTIQDVLSGIAYRVRLTRKLESRNGVIEFAGVEEDETILSVNMTTGATYYVPQAFVTWSATDFFLMDIPLLRDTDNEFGMYLAATGYTTSWRGCVLYKSADEGATWAEVYAVNAASKLGSSSTVLGDWVGGNMFDEKNTVTVVLRSGTLSSISELAVLNGGNVALLGNEIIQFKNAALQLDGTYTLSGLLRGRRGTEAEMSEHAIGERFALLTTGSTRRVISPKADVGLTRQWKAVTVGDTLDEATASNFPNMGVALLPYSPLQGYNSGKQPNGDFLVSWVRRTRVGGEWANLVEVSLGETTEAYDICFMGAEHVITSVSKEATVKFITSTSHGFTAGQLVHVYTLKGMSQLDDEVLTVSAVPSSTSFTVALNSVDYDSYVSGGRVRRVVKTINSLGAVYSTLYTVANQTTDFGSPQSSLVVHAFQLSSSVGKGKSGRWTL